MCTSVDVDLWTPVTSAKGASVSHGIGSRIRADMEPVLQVAWRVSSYHAISDYYTTLCAGLIRTFDGN